MSGQTPSAGFGVHAVLGMVLDAAFLSHRAAVPPRAGDADPQRRADEALAQVIASGTERLLGARMFDGPIDAKTAMLFARKAVGHVEAEIGATKVAASQEGHPPFALFTPGNDEDSVGCVFDVHYDWRETDALASLERLERFFYLGNCMGHGGLNMAALIVALPASDCADFEAKAALAEQVVERVFGRDSRRLDRYAPPFAMRSGYFARRFAMEKHWVTSAPTVQGVGTIAFAYVDPFAPSPVKV